MGRLLSEYDFENTILLEINKIQAIAEAMKYCDSDFLDQNVVPFIGKVILDHLESINMHIKNDCIFQDQDQDKKEEEYVNPFFEMEVIVLANAKIKSLVNLLYCCDTDIMRKRTLHFYFDVIIDASESVLVCTKILKKIGKTLDIN